MSEAVAAPVRNPVLPMDEVTLDRVYTFWLWYLAPFKKPKVPAECEAWVLDGMRGKINDRTKSSWQRSLARAASIAGDAAGALTRKPGSLPGDREMYRRKGFHLLQRAEGEVGNAEYSYKAWRPDMDGGEGYIGCRQLAEDLHQRLPWAIAQVDSRIVELRKRIDNRGTTANQSEYMEMSVGACNEALQRLVGPNAKRTDGGYDLEAAAYYSVPLPEELHAFFLRFDLVILQAGQDVRMKQQLALQGQITDLMGAEQAAQAAAREQIAAGVSA